MPLRSTPTTSNPDECRLDKSNARQFTVQVGNQTVLYELNVSTTGRGEQWSPPTELRPGYWRFTDSDFQEYGVPVAQGIRFQSLVSADPGVVTAS